MKKIETVHVCNRATCIYPFHEISCNFGSGVFNPPPHQPNSEKYFFHGFIHFMKFPAIWVQVYSPPPAKQ